MAYIQALKQASVFVLIAGLCIRVAHADSQENLIVGNWSTQDKGGVIEIYKTASGKYEGKIVDGRGGPDRKDDKNPDPAQRSQPLLGKLMLRDFHYDGSGKWSGGTIYDPDNGKTYRCKMELLQPSMLKIRGYVGLPIFGRTDFWTRLSGGQSIIFDRGTGK